MARPQRPGFPRSARSRSRGSSGAGPRRPSALPVEAASPIDRARVGTSSRLRPGAWSAEARQSGPEGSAWRRGSPGRRRRRAAAGTERRAPWAPRLHPPHDEPHLLRARAPRRAIREVRPGHERTPSRAGSGDARDVTRANVATPHGPPRPVRAGARARERPGARLASGQRGPRDRSSAGKSSAISCWAYHRSARTASSQALVAVAAVRDSVSWSQSRRPLSARCARCARPRARTGRCPGRIRPPLPAASLGRASTKPSLRRLSRSASCRRAGPDPTRPGPRRRRSRAGRRGRSTGPAGPPSGSRSRA